MRRSNVEVRRISTGCGSEIIGLDLTKPMTDEMAQKVKDAWNEGHGVLVIRDAKITPAQQVAFASRLGPLAGERPMSPMSNAEAFSKARASHCHPEFPEITRMSNMKDADGNALGREDAGIYWHADHCVTKTSARYSMLHAVVLPPTGGDTMFSDMYLAYDTLSDHMKRMIEGLTVVNALAKRYPNMSPEEAKSKSTTQPITRVVPETGRRALYVNRGFTSSIEGMHPRESDAILNFLFDHSEQPEFVYRHSYRPHDLVMWDNWCTIHYGVPDYKLYGGQRYMHRITIGQ